ncbi:cation transport protein ChaC [Devosia enhydra]|uniref:glutathione-specific gamma-glutamylcyclotransferase n=1 Tax=Devosia enhydra TaxID=665118 RepID=A0A1K2I016_9HYPH|nr:gamma-glutamylcyclotransferase [Devosia enhydra]SFZ85733.1 cation transport protein ChaC [Devosia enhydra]
MAQRDRPMRLTEAHVARVHRAIEDPGPQLLPGYRVATDADYDREVAAMLATQPQGGFWLFAYGSLIWKPETRHEDEQLALARGWHRRFCLGWDYRYRGSRETPGLMLALDRGGQCRGVAYRLPDIGLEDELHRLIRREQTMVPSAFPWRWIDVMTRDGPIRALAFAMNRNSGRYVAGLPDEELAEVLARACGFKGSMAEYLFATVSRLEAMGIRDRRLWRLQQLVAERIEALHGTP